MGTATQGRTAAKCALVFGLGLAISCNSTTPSGGGSGGGGGGANDGGTHAGSGGGHAHSGGSAPSESGGTHSGSGGTAATVTWAEHVAPLVFRECVGCHRSEGIAPFSLTDYASAEPYSASIALATQERRMPPMPVDGSGSCNTYSNARWLTDAEIALLASWHAAGAPEGDPSLVPELPELPPGLGTPDAILDMGAEYTPSSSGHDDYRCFIVDPDLAEDAFLTGYEVLPGAAHIVHHVIAYLPDSDAAAAAAEELDSSEAGLGYTCFGGTGVSATPLVLWAPGGGVISHPKNTGLPIPAGRKIVLQVHYNLHAGAEPDRTVVHLKLASSVAQPAAYLPIAHLSMVVEAGQEQAETTYSVGLSESGRAKIVAHGVLPHMHTLGRTLELFATDGAGVERCAVSVDRWDFHWQSAWWYETPLVFDPIAAIRLTCGYDTTSRTDPVTWGEGTEDEMCLVYAYVTADLP